MPKPTARIPGYSLSVKGWADAPLTDAVKFQALQKAIGEADEILREAGFDITVDFHPTRR